MGYRMLVIGAGLMAKSIAYDFVRQKDIDKVVIASLFLKDAKRLVKFLNSRKARAARLDAADVAAAARLMKDADCAVSAVPYYFNYSLAKAAVRAGCDFVDLGGNNDVVGKEFSLNAQAKKKNVAIVPDCGLAPGMASNIVALGLRDFKKVESVSIRVGGLPQNPRGPLNYMMLFAPQGLINEYIEPSVILEDYRIKKVESMTGVEKLSFKGLGRLEAFYTSGGTSTMPKTFRGKIKSLDYKTIRYPGHAEKIKAMIELGLCSSEPVEVGGAKVPPREVLEKLLVKNLTFRDRDIALVRVTCEDGKKKVVFELMDYQTGPLTAMMRTTGFHAAVIAEMLVRGRVKKKGTLRHELDIPPDIVVKELRARGLNIVKKVRHK
ncbi:MAG: saccharopine dehydrogenase [Planctomycetota bacterium]|nr:MAG: saccharopine dehydrogenase [Planctomycetota bacterium]